MARGREADASQGECHHHRHDNTGVSDRPLGHQEARQVIQGNRTNNHQPTMDILLVEGPSGTGKSYAWRNVPVEESVIITPNAKALSFGKTAEYRNSKVTIRSYDAEGKPTEQSISRLVQTDQLKKLPSAIKALAEAGVKYILLEDFTHYFSTMIVSDEFMKQGSGNTAFERWKAFALLVYKVIKSVETIKPGQPGFESTLVINHHVEFNEKLGLQSFKIFGKLLSDNIDPVSYITTVLHSLVIPGEKGASKYRLLLNNDGVREAKCPPAIVEMLQVDDNGTIANDIYPVLLALRKFNGYDADGMDLKL